ncbi:MAG: universal stress protein [Alphaproteobacteria bacterium]|nr:MAG: universal stress protein [Alphaproteobacteria bacterium]
MANALPLFKPPQKILLATDLSARSDRALDRATQLARQWNAGLIVVHALENQTIASRSPFYDDLPSWRRPPDPALVVERQIRRDLREPVADLRIIVTQGEAPEVILDVAAQERCDLIVVGATRGQGLGRAVLGRTVEYLIRRAPTSVLVVKSRPSGAYRHILVGTDFTAEAGYGLSVAAHMFPDAAFAVMHAFDMPYRSLSGASQLSRDFSAMEQEEIKAFVRDADMPESVRSGIVTLIEHGRPEVMIHNYVIEQNADLTVIGTVGHGRLFHLLIGGHAPKIVDGTPSDILVVRMPGAR